MGQRRTREITSADNPMLKVVRRALAEGVTREGWLAVEGPFLLEEALAATERSVVHSVLVSRTAADKFRDLLGRLPRDAEVVQVPDRLFGQVAQTQSPQGIAALVELRPDDWETAVCRSDALLLVACGLQDPGNLGTMMRSARALGATAVITLENTVSPFNPKGVRASAGAIFHLPIFCNQAPSTLFAGLHAAGVSVIAADRHSPSPLAQADLRGPVAILIGQEAAGLPPQISREANFLLSIPIRAGTDSVNAAVAASIFLYEAARQRQFRY